MVVEIDPQAEALIKGRLTRRIIALELGDVEIPVAAGEAPGSTSRTLFVRVLGSDAGKLRVELWEQGVFHGARVVTEPGGTEFLRARRIALAAGEIARRARRRRLAEQHHLAREQERQARLEAEARAACAPPRLALRADLQGATVGPGDAWLVGTALAGELRWRSGIAVRLGSSWLAGGTPSLAADGGLRWFEVSVGPAYARTVAPGVQVELGGTAAVAAVHLMDVAGVDDVAGQQDTWSARAGAELRVGLELSRAVRLSFGPEVGAVLRRVVVEDWSGTRERLGGLWVGATLGVTLGAGAASVPAETRHPVR